MTAVSNLRSERSYLGGITRFRFRFRSCFQTKTSDSLHFTFSKSTAHTSAWEIHFQLFCVQANVDSHQKMACRMILLSRAPLFLVHVDPAFGAPTAKSTCCSAQLGEQQNLTLFLDSPNQVTPRRTFLRLFGDFRGKLEKSQKIIRAQFWWPSLKFWSCDAWWCL